MVFIKREDEISHFKPEEYWTIENEFIKNKSKFKASFYGRNNKKIKLSNNDDVQKVLKDLDTKGDFLVTNVVKKERKQRPRPAFTTSTMQQVANNQLKFRTRKTMMAAQQLYEGINLGKHGNVGLITYMRTDSTRISAVAKQEAASYITENYGKEYSANNPQQGKLPEGAQDAHEGIRPTSVYRVPNEIKQYLTNDQYKLYKLIWNRFVASQMTDEISDIVTATIEQNNIQFKASGSKTKFAGFTKVYKTAVEKDNLLPSLRNGDQVKLDKSNPEQHFTQPPARYTEATLIHALEANGVGRPSTYAPTLDTIQRRNYVKLDTRRFIPTELGEIVNNVINEYFPDIENIEFTAGLEKKLDDIENGQNWVKIVDSFFKPFSKEVEKANSEMEKIEIKDEPAGFNCDVCGSPMVIKMGRFGKFYACSNFPECRNTKPIVKKIGVKCPKCHQGEIIERKSKKNRVFYGCSRYPECDFVSWDKPINRNCPKDGHFLVEKKVRGGKQIVCPNGDYEEDIQK